MRFTVEIHFFNYYFKILNYITRNPFNDFFSKFFIMLLGRCVDDNSVAMTS